MKENYNGCKLSCIMDSLISLVLISFVIYTYIYGSIGIVSMLLRILILLISI